MKGIFYISALLISYGSLYPFNFVALAENTEILSELMYGWNGRSHMGDILGNVILFIPYGYFGMFFFRRHTSARVLITAAALALILQILQVYLPSRDANIRDVWWNMIGASVGIAGALIPFLRADRFIARHQQLEVFPLMVAVSWIGYRLMPFVPSIDWQQIKNSLKPLLLSPQLAFTNVLHDAVAWLVIALIWQQLKPAHWPQHLIWLAIPAIFILEILIIHNSLSLSNVVGVMMAAAIWILWLNRQPNRLQIGLLLLISMLVINALQPFEFRSISTSFHWIPFYGFLGGAMMLNTAVVFEKFFLFGAALWLLQRQQVRLLHATIVMVIITFAIEAAQLVFDHHLAEVTDPILVVLIAMLCNTLQRLREQSLQIQEPPEQQRLKKKPT